jgi:hypothetical protein
MIEKTKTVEVRYDPEAPPETSVGRLETVTLKPHEGIAFSADAGTGATVFLPRADEIFGYSESYMVLDIDPGESSDALEVTMVLQRGDDPVTCAYAVYCKAAGDFAEGNSAPRMIIMPPDD